MPRASPVLREKVIDEQGNIREVLIWRLHTSPRSPSGVRYRLAFVRRDEENQAVLCRRGITGTWRASRKPTASSTWISSSKILWRKCDASQGTIDGQDANDPN